jgi:hypothetical protein
MKIVGLIKMFLNEIHGVVHTRKHLCNMFCIQNGVKQADALSLVLKLVL